MLKIKVIADNILNLTDARYFAAYGVEYLVFNLDNIDQASITEIKEWVEGVNILLEFKESLTPPLFNFILSLSPQGFVSDDQQFLVDLKSQLPEAEYLLRQSDGSLTNIDNHHGEPKPFVRISDSLPIEDALNSDEMAGIIVEGEPEEKVGFKNFDQLDELFDLIALEY